MQTSNFSMKDLHEYLEQNGNKPKSGDLLLDVRTPEEFKEGHIANSENINHEDVLNHIDTFKKYKTVYLYCRSGGRAGMANGALKSKGVTNVVAITGSGMKDWTASGFPIQK